MDALEAITLDALQLRLWALHAAIVRQHDSLSRRASEEAGQDMVEYALLLGLLSTVAIAFVILVGPQLASTFSTIVSSLQTTVGH